MLKRKIILSLIVIFILIPVIGFGILILLGVIFENKDFFENKNSIEYRFEKTRYLEDFPVDMNVEKDGDRRRLSKVRILLHYSL